ncbi:uncharacterized protein V2V93DRAFT_365813 [Kockiozyma suomiensis]|uniref:uncharacterized protein n=1 Tax=Kockiozyma suomiensis TaxID=1337062 RepID=UPI003343E420
MTPLVVSQSTVNAELIAHSLALDSAASKEREEFTLVVSKSQRKRNVTNRNGISQIRGDSTLSSSPSNDSASISNSSSTIGQASNWSRRRKAQSSKYKASRARTTEDYVAVVNHKLETLKKQEKFYKALFGDEIMQTGEYFSDGQKGIVFQALRTKNSPRVTHIRCLALGRVTESDHSLMQLAMLIALREVLEKVCRVVKLSCYDPDFLQMDTDVLSLLGVSNVIDDPGEVSRLVDESYKSDEIEEAINTRELISRRRETLYYMPHAPIGLVDKIMGLPGVQFVLGNDVMGYKDRLWGQVELMYPSLRAVIVDCQNAVDHEEKVEQEQEQEERGKKGVVGLGMQRWERIRLNDGLARDESWWMSVNDLAMHWRTG